VIAEAGCVTEEEFVIIETHNLWRRECKHHLRRISNRAKDAWKADRRTGEVRAFLRRSCGQGVYLYDKWFLGMRPGETHGWLSFQKLTRYSSTAKKEVAVSFGELVKKNSDLKHVLKGMF
jgi:hypothetical protein